MRLATFNLKHGAPADKYRGDPGLAAEACASLQADVLALQEVERGLVRSRFVNIAKLAAKASGMKVVFAKTTRFPVGSGNALLVRGEIEDYKVLNLIDGSRFQLNIKNHKIGIGHRPRNAILATARIQDRQISIAATHLSTQRQFGQEQLPKVINSLAPMPGPHVLMGDFNMRRRETLSHLSGMSMELADGPPTFPALNPNRSIDHIAVNGLAICDVEVVPFPISDHLALVVDVEWLSAPGQP